jgi:phenol/toluene 2-monooxygenase (NADH) P1/A1
MDERALLEGAGAYSLFAQHLTVWFTDQRKWLDALITAWREDGAYGDGNAAHLARINTTWRPRAQKAAEALSAVIDDRLQGGQA